VVLRPHIVYGPGDTTLLPRVLAARRGGRSRSSADGTQRVSATHVDNLAHAVDARARGAGEGGAFNVADAEPVPLATLVTGLLARLGRPTRLVPLPPALAWGAAAAAEWVHGALGARRGPRLTRYAVRQLAREHTLDLSRARAALGYAPRWTWAIGPLDGP
jgi:nucleoside-diphosphate-sugar epimerase